MREIAPRITVDAGTRFGRPVIQGTRVPVGLVSSKLAAGLSTEDICAEYDIGREDVLAALAHAARVVADGQVRVTQ